MDVSTEEPATMSLLTLDCLREILQYVPVLERVRLRRVCKQWSSAIDSCWSSVSKLQIKDKVKRSLPRTVIHVTSTALDVSTKNVTLARGLVDHCGQFLKSLRVESSNTNLSVLPEALQRCRQLEELEIPVQTESEDEQLSCLLLLNPKIIELYLFVTVQGSYRYRFFEYLSKNTLEDLAVTLSPPESEPRDYEELLQIRGEFLSTYGSVMGRVEDFVRGASALRKLVVDYVPHTLLRAIGERDSLETLVLAAGQMDDAFPFAGDVLTKWHFILSLRNLRKLHVNSVRAHPRLLEGRNPHQQMITDDFVEELVRHCPLLEDISLRDCTVLTDRSVHALSALRLTLLDLGNDIPVVSITDKYLPHFVDVKGLTLDGQAHVKDAGVVKLLRCNQVIHVLNLSKTGVTRRALAAAVKSTKGRTNGVKLNMYFCESEDFDDVENTSALLEVGYLESFNSYHTRAMFLDIAQYMHAMGNVA